MPGVRWVAISQGWVDKPDGKRKKHTKSTPNVGGVAIAASVAIGLVCLSTWTYLFDVQFDTSTILLVVGGIAIVVTGFFDDIYDMGFKQKFLVQIAVAYMLMHAGFSVEVSNLPFVSGETFDQALYSVPLTMLWIVGIMNAINLIDGLDGLAAGVSLIAFACLAAIFSAQGNLVFAALCFLMIGALAAFLVYNFNPALNFHGRFREFIPGLYACYLYPGSG